MVRDNAAQTRTLFETPGGAWSALEAVVPVFLTMILGDTADEAAEWFLGLLLGDLQIRHVIGQQNGLSPMEMEARCATALAALRRLLDAPKQKGAG